jgi:S-adenosylmethionine hydrolase
VTAAKRYFVGPDNGLFSYLLDAEEDFKVNHITAPQYFRQPVSNTFHGRDVFAPVAAELSRGLSPDLLGQGIVDAVRLRSIARESSKKGRIIHIDRFGNCVTNIEPDAVKGVKELRLNGKKIRSFHASYAEANKGPFAIQGSAGFLEISVKNGSAAKVLKARRGDEVTLV